jgi:hypothetical protein
MRSAQQKGHYPLVIPQCLHAEFAALQKHDLLPAYPFHQLLTVIVEAMS